MISRGYRGEVRLLDDFPYARTRLAGAARRAGCVPLLILWSER